MSADQIKTLSTEVGFIAQQMAVAVLLAGCGTATAAARLEAMARAWTLWPKLCRRMSELETLAPNSAALGQLDDTDFMERLERFRRRQSEIAG